MQNVDACKIKPLLGPYESAIICKYFIASMSRSEYFIASMSRSEAGIDINSYFDNMLLSLENYSYLPSVLARLTLEYVDEFAKTPLKLYSSRCRRIATIANRPLRSWE